MANKALYNLVSGLVLDRAVFLSLPSQDMEQCITNMRAANNKPLCIVSSAEEFFTHKTLFDFLKEGDKRFALVNEGLGGFLSQEQVNALLSVNKPVAPGKNGGPLHQEFPVAVQEQAIQAGDALQKIADIHQEVDGGVVVNMEAHTAYVMAAVPAGWSVNDYMSLGPTKIKRKMKNSDGDGTMFYMHPDDFYKLWTYASGIWGGNGDAAVRKFTTGMGVRVASVQDDRISLGGNYIRRYEIEQVAKHRGWAFPNGVKIAA